MLHRLANTKDFNAVYDMYMDDYANAYLTYDPMSKETFQPIYESLLKTDTLYVVENDGEVMATYRLIPKTDRQQYTIYLGGITIKDTSRGKGFGSQILSSIQQRCHENNKVRIELTVDVDNMPAISLYKKMGFVIEGTVRKSYKRSSSNRFYDEYLMAYIIE